MFNYTSVTYLPQITGMEHDALLFKLHKWEVQ